MEQLRRAERYLGRLRYAYEGIQEPSVIFSIDDPLDDCISFFMHCYHVKDWIKEIYCTSKEEKQALEDYINGNPELGICADICNGSKHYQLRSEFRSGQAQEVKATGHKALTYLTGTGGLEVHRCRFSVVSEDGVIDALELAEKCMELWNEYLARINA
jgi:hypothetical protein